VTASGVVLPLRLTHDSLARLVGAQRPTVSTALKSLQDAGEVTRRRDGAWVLLPESQERLRRLQERVAAVPGAIELIESPTTAQATAREHIARLQIAWEKNSASLMTLRRRMAELREGTKGLSGGVGRFRSNGDDGTDPPWPSDSGGTGP
jgi:DNA-binding transcriptional ArsR family regulator